MSNPLPPGMDLRDGRPRVDAVASLGQHADAILGELLKTQGAD